ncbi:type I secretion system permease/ATPase [Paraburkholderia sp. LEh10]|uniref:type I secretion system permease/ATPase n=1 Tax=Paraburkholderia sp. LEh10 TaxID=2821353 RepID=UPI001AE8D46C|nr:type I secretion system permease/ATPase [Paraburkholderia sp. LEh10]MBP0592610.1 type I secretion system permease/ATPase [Paraburkholderia sp. LEh10]
MHSATTGTTAGSPGQRAAREWDVRPATGIEDDPLLGCLLVLARLFDRPTQADTLIAGLPLNGQHLTPDLFVRAAARVGISARLAKRSLESISDLVLPAVLLLDNRQACVLVRRTADGSLRVILPETGTGEQEISAEVLQQRYAGHVLFARPAHRFDERSDESAVPRVRHWFWGVVATAWPIYGEVMLASLLVNMFALAMPLFTMNVYDRVVPNHTFESLWALAAGIILVIVFDLLMRTLRGYFIDIAGKKIDVILSANMFEKVLGIQMSARPPSVGGFASGIQEFEAVREFLTSATAVAVIDVPFSVVFLLAMFWVGGALAWLPVVALPLVVGVGIAVQGPLARAVESTQRHAAQRQSLLIETLVGLEAIKITGAEGPMQTRWEQSIGELARLGLRSRFLSGCAVNFASFAQQIAYLAVVFCGVYMIADGKLTTGGLIACTTFAGRALSPMGQVATLLTRYHQSRSALASIGQLMNLPGERPADKRFVHRPTLRGDIEFRNVSFAYPRQSGAALDGVSFRIAAGERVAIIGRVGSGKTTIEKLILGLYPPTSGNVLIDGVELRQWDPAALRRGIGHVPQDVMLFSGSVKDNIMLGAPGADDAAVLRAAQIAGVTDFVNRLPNGFDLPVGERGEALSGGQRQAIAIARAELLAPPVLVLDEPSSAMDNRSEEMFKARLAAELESRTLIVITHRASLLSLVNRVIVMDQGRVVADGPKDQVLAALAGRTLHVAAG